MTDFTYLFFLSFFFFAGVGSNLAVEDMLKKEGKTEERKKEKGREKKRLTF